RPPEPSSHCFPVPVTSNSRPAPPWPFDDRLVTGARATPVRYMADSAASPSERRVTESPAESISIKTFASAPRLAPVSVAVCLVSSVGRWGSDSSGGTVGGLSQAPAAAVTTAIQATIRFIAPAQTILVE